MSIKKILESSPRKYYSIIQQIITIHIHREGNNRLAAIQGQPISMMQYGGNAPLPAKQSEGWHHAETRKLCADNYLLPSRD